MALNGYKHGNLMCGTLMVNDIDQAAKLYSSLLLQDIVEEIEVSPSLAASWGAPNISAARSCLLQPSGSDKNGYVGSYIRLIQSPEIIEPTPHATSYGWCAFEINVNDVFSLAETLKGSEFTIVGPPKRMDGISNVIPMQVVGPDQEVLYLNQVLSSSDATELPVANHTVDQFFIAVLASQDRESGIKEYCRQVGLDNVDTHDIRYSLINRAFDLDSETTHKLSVIHKGRLPVVEIDQYPSFATSCHHSGCLPLGNAMVSIAVASLDELPLTNAVAEVQHHDSVLYRGSRSVVIRGSSNELIELIEHQANGCQ